MFCPQCGAQNTETAKFCAGCGRPLQAEAARANPAPAAPPPASPPAPASYGYSAQPPTYGYSAPQDQPNPPAPQSAYGYNAPVGGPAPQPGYGAPPAQGGYGAPAQAPPTYTYSAAPGYSAPPPSDTARVAAAPSMAPSAPRKSHLLRNVLLVFLLLAVVGVGAGAYFLNQTFNKTAVPAARLLPADVYGYLTVSTHPDSAQKASVDKLQAAFKSQPGFQAAWDKIFKETGDSTSAVKSTLGDCSDTATTPAADADGWDTLNSYLGNNATVAMLPLTKGELAQLSEGSADAEKLLLPKVLAFVDLDFNPLNKKGLLPKLKQAGDKPTDMPLVEKYRDIEIRTLPTQQCSGSDSKPPTVYVTLIDGTAAVGFDVVPLRGVIDHYKDGHALQDNAAFQAMQAELPKDRLGTLYLNMTSIYNTAQSLIPADMAAENPAANFQLDGTAAIVLTAHDDGLQIDSVSDIKMNGQAWSGAAFGPTVLNDVPAGSWAFFSGTDLKTSIEQALAMMRKQGQGQEIDDFMAQAKEQMGVDFEHDLLPLLGGDYSVSVQGTKGTSAGDFASGPDLGVVAQLHLKQGDGARMSQVLETLNTNLTDQGATITDVVVGNGKLWSADMAESALYGVIGDKLLIVGDTNVDATTELAKSVVDNAGKGAGADSTLKGRLAHLPKDSNTLLYVDINKIRADGFESTLSSDDKTGYEQDVAPFVRPFQYVLLGGSSTVRNDAAHSRSVLFIGIGK
jgi:hypothetical protein